MGACKKSRGDVKSAMLVFGAILSLGILAVIIYLALSKKSGKFIRLAAVIALVVIGISLIVSLVILLGGPSGSPKPAIGDFPVKPAAPANTDVGYLVTFLVMVLLLLGLIVYVAMREKKQKGEAS
jgi:heme/copper-type cytochrome/quinol oxidase subunit 4